MYSGPRQAAHKVVCGVRHDNAALHIHRDSAGLFEARRGGVAFVGSAASQTASSTRSRAAARGASPMAQAPRRSSTRRAASSSTPRRATSSWPTSSTTGSAPSTRAPALSARSLAAEPGAPTTATPPRRASTSLPASLLTRRAASLWLTLGAAVCAASRGETNANEFACHCGAAIKHLWPSSAEFSRVRRIARRN